MGREITHWITINGNHVPIYDSTVTRSIVDYNENVKERQIAKQRAEANRLNGKFVDGDTPKVIDKNGIYRIMRVALDDSKDADLGENRGNDTALILKGFHYEEPIPGDGMWYKSGVKYGYDVKRVK